MLTKPVHVRHYVRHQGYKNNICALKEGTAQWERGRI